MKIKRSVPTKMRKSEFNIIQSGEYILFDEDKKYSQVISKIDFEKKYKRKFENIYEEVQTDLKYRFDL